MKTASRILLSLSFVIFLAGMTFSQVASTSSPEKITTEPANANNETFVDANKNGICDHHEAKETCLQGKNFVDKNGDGVCDNCGSSGKCKGTGCGQGKKDCNGCGKGQVKGKGCGEGQGKGNCCGQGQQGAKGCSHQGVAPATKPKK
ncbi:MAG: hypothetical protein WCK84_07415 [Bacteroidota bacterium]